MSASSSRSRASASDPIQLAARELESVVPTPDGIYEALIAAGYTKQQALESAEQCDQVAYRKAAAA